MAVTLLRVSVPENFKHTEIGPVPSDWEVVPLQAIGKIITGKTPPTKDKSYWNGPIPFITPIDLQGGPIRRTARTITKAGLKVSKALPKGTVVVSCIGYIGKVGVIDSPVAVTNQQINAVIVNNTIGDNWYLAYTLMHLEPILNSRARVTTVPILNKSNFQRILIPLPPLPEQRAIAYVLRTVQRAKEATERVIAALKELKKSLMRHFFTYGPVPLDAADQVALQDTPIGPFPAHWRLIKLGEVAEKPQYGYTSSAVHDPVGPKFLRITDIQNDRVQWASVPYCVIEDGLLHKYRLRRGDILFARIGATTGKTYLISECPPAVFASYLIRIRTNASQLLPEYLYFFTHTSQYWQQINAAKGGRLKQGINYSHPNHPECSPPTPGRTTRNCQHSPNGGPEKSKPRRRARRCWTPSFAPSSIT